MKKTAVFILVLVFSSALFSQTDTTFPPDYKMNSIKWNVTPFILWSNKNINVSYERVLTPYRTFSVNAGYFEFMSTGIYDKFHIIHKSSKGGANISGDYRFYFKKRNKLFAPDGLYWGPYGSFYFTQFGNEIMVVGGDLAQGKVITETNIGIFSGGLELGYQFVIKERFTIDLIFMGPSLSVYRTKIALSGDIDINEESEYLNAIRDVIINRFPFLPELINNGEFSSSGSSTSFGFGMRYMIQLGYRF